MSFEWKDSELGPIPQNWNIKRVEEIGEVVGGGTPSTKNENYYDGDISWITPKDLSNHTKRYIYQGKRSITKEGLGNSSAKMLPKGTVLFSSRAPIGYVAIAGKELCTNQGFKSIVCNDTVNNQFIYYTMKMAKEAMETIAGGSTFKEVSGSIVKQFKIKVPPLDEQIGIVGIISALDDKIELNNAINKNLEEMAQTLFKRWFVDFEFPNENGEPYKSSGGEFEESELGLIPKGWNISSLKDISTIMMGQSPKSEYYNTTGEGLPFHQGVSDYGYRFPKHNTFCTNLLRVAKKDSILISVRAPVGRLNIADRDIVIGRGLGAINSIINCNSYLFYLLKRIFAVEDRHGSGTIFNSITKKEVEEIKVISPSSTIIHRFENIVKNIDQQISVLSAECDYLAQIRDTLLPKLMSGEIRVPVERDNSATELPMVAESSAIYQP